MIVTLQRTEHNGSLRHNTSKQYPCSTVPKSYSTRLRSVQTAIMRDPLVKFVFPTMLYQRALSFHIPYLRPTGHIPSWEIPECDVSLIRARHNLTVVNHWDFRHRNVLAMVTVYHPWYIVRVEMRAAKMPWFLTRTTWLRALSINTEAGESSLTRNNRLKTILPPF